MNLASLRILLLWLFFSSLSSHGQVVEFEIQNDNIGFISKLAYGHNRLWLVSEDNIWFHNGNDFSVFEGDSVLRGITVLDVAPSDSGIWIGTLKSGLGFYNLQKGKLSWPFATERGYPEIPYPRTGIILSVSDTGVWAQIHHFGLGFFDLRKTEITFFETDNINGVSQRGNHIVSGMFDYPNQPRQKIITTLGGVLILDLHTQTFFRYLPTDRDHLVGHANYSGDESRIRDAIVSDDSIYLATWGGGLLHMDLKSGFYHKYTHSLNLPSTGLKHNIARIYPESDSTFLLSHIYAGVFRFNKASKSFHLLTDPLANPLFGEAKDWTYIPGGIAWSENNKFYVLDTAHTNNWDILRAEGKVDALWKSPHFPLQSLLSINDTLIWKDGIQVIPVERYSDIISGVYRIDSSRVLLIRPNMIRLYTGNQLSLLEFPSSKFGTAGEIVTTHFEAVTQKLTLGTKGTGIHQFDFRTNEWRSYQNPSLLEFWIKCMDRHGDRWCVVTENSILLTNSEFAPLQSVNFKEIAELPAGMIPNGVEWVDESHIRLFGKEDGIYVIQLQNLQISEKYIPTDYHSTRFNQYCIWNDTYLIGTDNGLLKIGRDSSPVLFGPSYQLQNVNHLVQDGNVLHFVNGRKHYRWTSPFTISRSPLLSSPIIQSFRAMGKSIHPINEITLQPTQNWLEWQIVASNFHNPNKGDVYVQLKGISDNWRKLNGEENFSISNLDPGTYILNAKTYQSDLGFSPVYNLMSVRILPEWYQRWWFYFLMMITVGAAAYSIYRYRIEQIEREQRIEFEYKDQLRSLEMRMLRVQMNPHFIFNALNSVRYYILKEDKNTASDYLAKFSKLLRFILNLSNQENVSLHEEIQGVKNYIEFEQIRFNKKFIFEIEIGTDLNTQQIVIQPMIIQPFIENAIWHGLMPLETNGHLKLSVQKEGNHLIITISDNGVGRESALSKNSKAHKSFGLSITAERLKSLSEMKKREAKFEITDLFEDGKPSGTRVKITMPYESSHS